MITIIAGSRGIEDPSVIDQAVEASGFMITRLISGGCRGVDKFCEAWAFARNIPITRVKPKWDLHGLAAGPIRNREIAEIAEALIAIRAQGESKGTDSMIKIATAKGLRIHIHHVGLTPKQQNAAFWASYYAKFPPPHLPDQ